MQVNRGVLSVIVGYTWSAADTAIFGRGDDDLDDINQAVRMTDYNDAMCDAAKRGYMDIVEKMILLGAYNYHTAIRNAAEGGHIEMLDLMMQWDDIDTFECNRIMAYAAMGEYIPLIEKMLARLRIVGDADYDWAMAWAAMGGHITVVEKMLSLGATNYSWAMWGAVSGGHITIVEKMLLLSGSNVDYVSVIGLAKREGWTEIVKLIEWWRATH